jgi:hypothetical protein
MTAVSPFDGANRIRFKGSLVIADLRLAMFQTLSVGQQVTSAPPKLSSCQCDSEY